jgi:recombination protein RecT
MTTKKREELKNQLAQTANTQAAQVPKKPEQLVGDYIAKNFKAIQSVLPKHISAERMARIALNVIRTNPQLLECSMPSLMGGVMEAAKLGLEIGLMGQCYLIPFKKKDKQGNVISVEAQFVIGYRGLIDLVRRSGQVSTIEAREVCENDEFDFSYGLEDKLVHKPKLTDRGAVIAYYAIAKMKDGGYSFLVMSKEDIEKHRDKYAKAKEFGPWKDDFDAMAKKTVLRQLIKYLPISVEYLQHDEKSGTDVIREVADDSTIIDMGEIPKVDTQTNEIIEAEGNE